MVENVKEIEEKNESKKDNKERPPPPLIKKQKRNKKVIQYIRPKNRRNSQNLRFDYFTARRLATGG